MGSFASTSALSSYPLSCLLPCSMFLMVEKSSLCVDERNYGKVIQPLTVFQRKSNLHGVCVHFSKLPAHSFGPPTPTLSFSCERLALCIEDPLLYPKGVSLGLESKVAFRPIPVWKEQSRILPSVHIWTQLQFIQG